MRQKRSSVFLLASILLSACQSPPEMDVAHQWADATRRLNMFGFYPQSEDVQVGDVFLHAPPPAGSPSLSRFDLLKVGSFHPDKVLGELQGQQARSKRPTRDKKEAYDRLTIQPLPAKDTAGAITNTKDCGGYDIGHADESGCTVRMQRAAMPGLSAGRITTGQLGGAGIFGNFGARLGIGASGETAVSLSFLNLQDLALDAWRVSRLREDNEIHLMSILRAERLLSYLAELRPDLLVDGCNGNMQRLAAERIEFIVVTRVMYAGGLNTASVEMPRPLFERQSISRV